VFTGKERQAASLKTCWINAPPYPAVYRPGGPAPGIPAL